MPASVTILHSFPTAFLVSLQTAVGITTSIGHGPQQTTLQSLVTSSGLGLTSIVPCLFLDARLFQLSGKASQLNQS